MRPIIVALILLSILFCGFAGDSQAKVLFSGEKKLNGLVSELLEVSAISKSSNSFTFARSRDGWVFVSATFNGNGAVRVVLDKGSDPVILHDADGSPLGEGMRFVTKGKH